jgi:hypothetical protein
MSRLRLKGELVSSGVQTFLKLAFFLPDNSCTGMLVSYWPWL